MINLPWRKTRPGLVGLQISDIGIGLACTNGDVDRPLVETCEWLQATDTSSPAGQLRDRADQLQLAGRRCNVVLANGSYSLLLVEAPNVAAEELRDAVRFRIRDMISYPLEEALVDVFPLPPDSTRSGRKMVYAVVAEKQKVLHLIELVESCGLELNAIDVSELALRNLLERAQQGSRGVAGVHLLQGKGMLTLLRGGQLYLSRHFDLAYNAGLFDEIPVEQLLLELQRSLDYYERQMGQVPPDSIYLFGDNISAAKISDDLRSGVSAQLNGLPLAGMLSLQNPVDDALLQLCVAAIGATLRRPAAA